MPWSNNGGGGWQGGQGPWGSRPPGRGGGGGPQPPDLDELLRRSQEKVRQLFPGGGGGGPSKRVMLLAGAAALVVWGLSGVYRVLPEEKGVELMFGRLSEITDPGLRIHYPWPIGTVLKPQVTRVNRVEVGFRSGATATTSGSGRTTTTRDVNEESLMLTGDENIVDINFVVFWKIQDPAAYLFNIREPENTVKAAAESVVREIIGQTPIIEATTEGRRAIELRGRERLQELMNEYGAGITIDEMQLQKADPPQEVIDAFRDVQRAQADRERAQNEAESFANDIIPRARGEAERLLQEAQAYRQEVVARAQGEAQRFTAILEQYNTAQDVTRKRLYLETMEQVLSGMTKVLIDQPQNAQGVLPFLPLPELQPNPGGRGGAAAAPTFGAPTPEVINPPAGSQ